MRAKSMAKRLSAVWVFSLLTLSSLALSAACFAERVMSEVFAAHPFSHHVWHEVLSTYVDDGGRVSWVSLRGHPRRLMVYLKQIALVSPINHPEDFPSRDHQLAYWLNIHNAIALKQILDAYPVERIEEIPAYWTLKRYVVGGEKMSLEDIQAQVLSFQKTRPWAILALSDFSTGSPPVWHHAYDGARLRRDLPHKLENAVLINENPKQCGVIQLPLLAIYKHHGDLGDSILSPPSWQQYLSVVLAGLPGELQAKLKKPCPGNRRKVQLVPLQRMLREPLVQE
ncbi:MAG: DUF547 domain-containing protein [Cyanobacteria bacterium]|nr:DUF547 domain-containing protein [Cyanobacteriota bacterium]